MLASAGDGGTFDIGLASLSGATKNNEDIIYVCLDNEAYMNTGIQVSSATPSYAWTGTTPRGIPTGRKTSWRLWLPITIHIQPQQLLVFPMISSQKIIKAKSIRGTKFIHMLVPCPTGWRTPSDISPELSILSVETNVFPLYEVEKRKENHHQS